MGTVNKEKNEHQPKLVNWVETILQAILAIRKKADYDLIDKQYYVHSTDRPAAVTSFLFKFCILCQKTWGKKETKVARGRLILLYYFIYKFDETGIFKMFCQNYNSTKYRKKQSPFALSLYNRILPVLSIANAVSTTLLTDRDTKKLHLMESIPRKGDDTIYYNLGYIS